MSGIWKMTKMIPGKVLLHATLKAKYIVRKAKFLLSSAVGYDSRKKNEEKVAKNLPENYSLHIFLQLPLEKIDERIRTTPRLYDLILMEGEHTYNDEWLILNARHKDMFDCENGHYRWTEELFTHFNYKNCFYMDARRQKTLPNTDVKIPWETARMQSLFSLALAYRASYDEKYARKIIEIIRDFCVCCPCGNGVNWNVSMEVGIRICNILLACELISDSQSFDESFRHFLATTVYEHMLHIRRNMENEKNGGNHLLADLLGLAATSAAIPFLPDARRCVVYVQKMLRRELMRQVLPDGGNFEGSTSYQRLVGEILCFSVIAQKKIGFSLTKEENERLAKMGEFTSGLRMKGGLVPQFGDNDSGRVFQLASENTRDHDSFINLVATVTQGKIVYPEKMDGFFVFYPEDIIADPELYKQVEVKEFPQFKTIRFMKDDIFVAICGMTPESNNKAGHSHNDVLSFALSVGDEEFIVDPGSGEYTGNHDIRHKLRSVVNHSTVSIDGNEQRLKPDNPIQVFQWKSSVKSDIRWEQKNSDNTFIIGKCSYITSSGNAVAHERSIVISKTTICLQDSVTGMVKECSIALPIFPNLLVEAKDDCVYISGKKATIKISGSWSFTIDDSYFAEQYKKTVSNSIVRGTSPIKDNWLLIEVLK